MENQDEGKRPTFWERVDACPHKNLSPDYDSMATCSALGDMGCSAYEDHCLDCGVYISNCGCGAEFGYSGWSAERWRRYLRAKP